MRRKHRTDPGDGADSVAESSTDDNSRNSGIDTYSDRNTSSGSELSELAIHTLLVETQARDLDISDGYIIPGERVFDNAADDLETIAVSQRSMSLLPQKEVVGTDLQPIEQEAQPLETGNASVGMTNKWVTACLSCQQVKDPRKLRRFGALRWKKIHISPMS